jgi:hypothetical protein
METLRSLTGTLASGCAASASLPDAGAKLPRQRVDAIGASPPGLSWVEAVVTVASALDVAG